MADQSGRDNLALSDDAYLCSYGYPRLAKPVLEFGLQVEFGLKQYV
jgi:hypothetical protein